MTDGNGGPMSGLKGYLTEIDLQDDALDEMRSEYMNRCKGPRAQIKEIMKSAKEADLDMPSFRVLLQEHRDQRRHEKRVAGLEEDSQVSYSKMVEILGDFAGLPLGASALDRAKRDDSGVDDLRS